ncbi:hypothetical protein NPIL_530571, partial [Nephila pilipes]
DNNEQFDPPTDAQDISDSDDDEERIPREATCQQDDSALEENVFWENNSTSNNFLS